MTSTPTPEGACATPVRPVVLVTGAARRLGREIALDLARHGHDVVVHYRHSEAEALATVADLQALGARACALPADLADEAACRALPPRCVAALGRLDAVVHSASTFEFDDVRSFSYAMLERHLRANTAPAIVLAQALAEQRDAQPPLPGEPPAVVVNLLDQKLWNPNPDFFSYTLSKAALESATTLLALALAPRVRVAGVAPGLTLTSEWLQGEKFEALHRSAGLLGRSSTAEDVARTVRFVIETRSITGTTLLVDAGQHLRRFERDFSLM
ncbi:NAD(P)-dependent dehydrogenase (short-subunit alcohol dehydrogenase family) [Sphaerotilus hippei]|uniref:NAD(P)-dependent dehydrogenase (Short-subunit alcohol dehydrogenase family) n=1 Tax=Sphaerotilus hippei TaxID=744406 RepID=A0A318H5G1_9BURK|nr:SDR family oxidoreductase [Sphaerotilus hippei]PXW99184.1 NAD(P)-dependent dehydrogenase (short-subunit alcohol dehydrogenase family) [Sphaerotilus hippei]